VLNPDNREATLAQIILSQANHLGEGSTAQLDAKKEDFAGAAAGNAWAVSMMPTDEFIPGMQAFPHRKAFS